jgi:hypothetical protein
VNFGKVGLSLFSESGRIFRLNHKNVKGILKRENGVVLAEFENIGKDSFTPVKIYNNFSATAPVYLELYKPGTTEPYSGSEIIKVK